MGIPSFQEDHISQIPALQFLQNLGYTYLTPEEALQLRGGKTTAVLPKPQTPNPKPQTPNPFLWKKLRVKNSFGNCIVSK